MHGPMVGCRCMGSMTTGLHLWLGLQWDSGQGGEWVLIVVVADGLRNPR